MLLKHIYPMMLVFLLIGCAHLPQSLEEKEKLYAPVEASLVHLNQKVASHFLVKGIPDEFNAAVYGAALKEVCRSNPECLSQANTIIDSYKVDARKIDDMFSVLLCDKEKDWKIMEDLSCNNLRVEIQTWKSETQPPCLFEANWENVKKEYCSQ